MPQSSINIRMDEDLKKKFEEICIDLGLNMSVAFNVFAKAVVRKKGIPFEISLNNDPFYSDENIERLNQSLASLKAGRVIVQESDEEPYGKDLDR